MLGGWGGVDVVGHVFDEYTQLCVMMMCVVLCVGLLIYVLFFFWLGDVLDDYICVTVVCVVL